MDDSTFDQYSKALKEAAKLREQLKVKKQHAEVLGNLTTYLLLYLPDPANDPSVKQARKETSAILQTITTTVG